MAVELDEIDLLLLTELQADADRTNVELARLVGLSPAATLNRVRRLKQSGVIKVITARLDPAAVGFPLQMYVGATLGRHDPRSTRLFEDQVRAMPQIIAADNVTGEMDYLLTVVARDVAELQQVLAPLAARGGQRLVTYLRLEEIKPPSRLPLLPERQSGSGAVTGATGPGAVRRLTRAPLILAWTRPSAGALGPRALLTARPTSRSPGSRRPRESPATRPRTRRRIRRSSCRVDAPTRIDDQHEQRVDPHGAAHDDRVQHMVLDLRVDRGRPRG